MSSNDIRESVDVELLDLAEGVLRESGYQVQRDDAEGEVLLAEDSDNVVALTALVSVDSVIEAEPLLSRLLSERFAAVASSPKRWDGYVVLLTSGRPTQSTAALYSITYNLSKVRRVVRVSVEPTRAAVRRALRPILPLTAVQDHISPGDALGALEDRLVADGVPLEEVSLAMGEFRAKLGETATAAEVDQASESPGEEP